MITRFDIVRISRDNLIPRKLVLEGDKLKEGLGLIGGLRVRSFKVSAERLISVLFRDDKDRVLSFNSDADDLRFSGVYL